MAKVKVIVVTEDLLGRGDYTLLEIEVREFITNNSDADAINFAQKLIAKSKKLD